MQQQMQQQLQQQTAMMQAEMQRVQQLAQQEMQRELAKARAQLAQQVEKSKETVKQVLSFFNECYFLSLILLDHKLSYSKSRPQRLRFPAAILSAGLCLGLSWIREACRSWIEGGDGGVLGLSSRGGL